MLMSSLKCSLLYLKRYDNNNLSIVTTVYNIFKIVDMYVHISQFETYQAIWMYTDIFFTNR